MRVWSFWTWVVKKSRAIGGLGRRHEEPRGKHGGGRGGEKDEFGAHGPRLMAVAAAQIRL
jgi:hypothetical protein